MRLRALFYLYRRRLRVHAVQELLAGLGVAIGVALVFATIVASDSVTGSTREIVHAVIGPASLQLRARGADGMPERLLANVERLPGVRQAAPLLEQTATVVGPEDRRVTVELAGADTSLVVLDGLAHTLPTATLSAGGIGLSETSARALDPSGSGPHIATGTGVSLQLRGQASGLKVSAVLGPEAFGALSQATVAVMPLTQLQRLAGLRGRITRVLVQTEPGAQAKVRAELQALARDRLQVAPASQDVGLLHQALRPSEQASGFFAAVSALLGLLLAFNALLLTVPERRRTIADLRLIGVRRSAIAQMFLFQALCLAVIACAIGVLGGYLLSLDAFHQSTRYLTEAFTLGKHTVVGAQPLLLAFAAGVLATCLASAVPLLDLRRARTLDAVYQRDGVPGNTLSATAQRALALMAIGLLALTTVLFALAPTLALLASAMLALATVLSVPLTFELVLRAARALAAHRRRWTILPVALSSLRATTLRSLALAATGAVALFGSVALGGARGDLLQGIQRFAHSYSADASIWVGNAGDNQAVVDFHADRLPRRIAQIPGVSAVRAFQGGFLEIGDRRVWIIARPPGANRNVLESQIVGGDRRLAVTRLGERGWIAISRQIAEEHHVGVDDPLTLPTPSGPVRFRIAATTTNLAWSPGVVFMSSSDYSRLWQSTAPSALGVQLAPNANPARIQRAIERTLGPASGLQVTTAGQRQASIDRLTTEGLSQLGEISTLLLLAAILAMAAALTSSIWQRRTSLAGLRLSGARPHRLRMILLCESALMLSAGCVTGAVAGIFGQVVIDGYLKHVTGFPVVSFSASFRPLEIFAAVIAIVLAIVAIPGYAASRVPPTLAFSE
jgi:putative ABC transport system permease protein